MTFNPLAKLTSPVSRLSRSFLSSFSSSSTAKPNAPNAPSSPSAKKSLATLRALYASSTPITVLTAYDYPTALHADRAGVDITLVGDSLGMVCLGQRTTQAVTLDQMIHHAQAARRGTQNALLVADLPFGTYESSIEKAVDNAVRLVKETSIDAIKIEGGINRAKTVHAIVDAGIAVMGHVGLLPQAISRIGTFRATGRSAEEAYNILLDAQALEEAGAFSMVVECVPARVAQLITAAVGIPTIGIGSGSACSGQVLVYHDLLRILHHPHHNNVAPKFSKPFAHLGPVIDDALRTYCHEVRTRQFPSAQFSPYSIPDDQFIELEKSIANLQEDKVDKTGVKDNSTRSEQPLQQQQQQQQQKKTESDDSFKLY